MSDMISQAKAALSKSQDFTKSIEGKSTSSMAPKHEFSHASYSMAHKPASAPNHEVGDIASGLKWKAEQVNAVSK